MKPIIKDMLKHSKFNYLVKDIVDGEKKLSITGLNDAAKAHMIYALYNYTNKLPFVVCQNVSEAKRIIQDFAFYDDKLDVVYIPPREVIYYNIQTESREIINDRAQAISKLLNGDNCIYITTIDAFITPMLPKSAYENSSISVKINEDLIIEDVVQRLNKLGYTRTELVEGKGQYSVRGGIIDIFPVQTENPYRIELFGETVDSIRIFSIIDQKSISNVDSFSITFSDEFILSKSNINNCIEELNHLLENSKIDSDVKNQITDDIEKLENGESVKCIDKYFNLLVPNSVTIIDYLTDDHVIYINETTKCKDRIDSILFENQETLRIMTEKKLVYPKYTLNYLSFDEIEERYKHISSVYIERINQDRVMHAKRKEYGFSCREVNFFRSTVDILVKDIQRYIKEQKIILLVLASQQKIDSFAEILEDNNIFVRKINNDSKIEKYEPGVVYCFQGILSCGFELPEQNLVIVSENISYIKRNENRSKKDFLGDILNSYEDLKVGDFVVHINHGIGRYLGLETVDTMGVVRDYMKVEYKDGGILYVPVTNLDSIKKYVAEEGYSPKLNKLGTKEWEHSKEKVKANIELIAKDLVELYSERTNIKGHAFSKDTLWQEEFESDFEYELTLDQERCIKELKESMEKDVPMDRLLCGDVGYGKTEVAIRGAFKAVMDSKQVAYLVPTTVLSLQQYNVFKDRMDKYGIKVEMLSRFKTKKEQAEIVEKLKTGEIDVVIGTHRLLSEDVGFKDLGFLIIDEEHRFGVGHKEKIKKYKNSVDVLSMTATPIPRTLHMSMIGIREISVILDPPQERLPVHTYVLEYEPEIVKEAIEKELSRDGQILYINNRVENIDQVMQKVGSLVPDARIAFAHGKMSPTSIENIMIKYMNHELDVLVCTTILESGIDIPNANTIIVENSDKLGLAQLYQIRGRVGRSNRLAYAYITYNKRHVLTEESEKRLRAIKEYTEFGSGIKIALRDLEIRGAGNLLGAQQHGHMMLVGYEMYVDMLKKAVDKKKLGNLEEVEIKEQSEKKTDIKINIDISANIPSWYIKDPVIKIEMYQKLSNATSEENLLDVVDEMIDRFGQLPKETENLLEIVKIRNRCSSIQISEIKRQGDFIVFLSENGENNIKYKLTKEIKSDIFSSIKNMLNDIEKTIGIKKL